MFSDEANKKREYFLERAMYRQWQKESGETNELWIEHLKKCVKVAIKEELTETQRKYIGLYLSGYNQLEISAMCCVNKSTVSRTIDRGMRRLLRCVKYATPRTLSVEKRVRKNLVGLYK